jgi:tetratricopeptide (TPR) repeat protein
VATDPRNLTAAFNLASVLVLNKKVPEAITLLEGYVKEFDQDPGLFSRLGDAYFTEKKIEPALKNYNKAFALDAKHPRLAHRLATIHGLMNNPKEVEKYLGLAVEEDPKDFQALASFGSMLLFNGKVEQAISVTKQSLQVKPTSEAYITLGTAYEARGDLSNSLISFQRARDLGDSRKELSERIKGLETRIAKKEQGSSPQV